MAKGSEAQASPVTSLKDDGNRFFASRQFDKALGCYTDALKQLPDTATSEKADLLCNRAACYFQMKQFKEAAQECTDALQLAPAYPKALQRRARSLEQQGAYKQALADIQAVNRSDAATAESRDTERRLREAVAGRRPAGLGSAAGLRSAPAAGSTNAAAAAAAAQQQQRRPQVYAVTAKVAVGGETRLLHLTTNSTYAQVLDGFKAQFPNAGPCQLKYTNPAGATTTLATKEGVRAAVADAVAADPLKPLRLEAAPCGESDVPPVPEDESAQLAAIKRNQEILAARMAEAQRQAEKEQERAAPQVAHTPSGAVVSIDDWLIDWANAFRDASGLDADRHIDYHNEGWDATSRAMEPGVAAADASSLFDAAADRFREVTCTGLLNWGNVAVCVAHKAIDNAAEAGEELGKAAAAAAAKAYDEAEARYKEALKYDPAFFDALCALGQLEFDRAKLATRLLVKPTQSGGQSGGDAAEGATAALKAALTRVKAEDVQAARPHMAASTEWYAKAAAAAAALDEKRKAAAAAAADGADADAAAANGGAGDEGMSYRGQAEVMEGNTLFEWSQLLSAAAAPGDAAGEWRKVLDAAVAKFRAAGCSEADVRNALKNHSRAGDLGLGPEEGEAAAAAAATGAGAAKGAKAAEKEAGPKAKGLPSLDKGGAKGKKK